RPQAFHTQDTALRQPPQLLLIQVMDDKRSFILLPIFIPYQAEKRGGEINTLHSPPLRLFHSPLLLCVSGETPGSTSPVRRPSAQSLASPNASSPQRSAANTNGGPGRPRR